MDAVSCGKKREKREEMGEVGDGCGVSQHVTSEKDPTHPILDAQMFLLMIERIDETMRVCIE